MSAISIQPSYPIFNGLDGRPLEGGFVYIGQANLDPITNPIQIYWDPELTVPAEQPIRLIAGYPARNGTPAVAYAAVDHSIRVLDKNGGLVYSSPFIRNRYPASIIGGIDASQVAFKQSGTGAVDRTTSDKLGESVSVLDFGADPTGATDSSAAFDAACATGKSVFVPKGTYQASFGLRNSQIIFGEGTRLSSVIIPPAGASHVIKIEPNSFGMLSKQHCQIKNISIENPNNVAGCVGIFFAATSITEINDNHTIENVFISSFDTGIKVTERLILCAFTNVEVAACNIGMHIVGDSSNYAINLNTFNRCRWISCVYEGVKITGYNIANKFISCNVEGNNTSNTVGIAGMHVEDAEGLFLDNPYFELNGGAVAVDAINPLNNSIGLYLTGSRCFNARVVNGWMVQSGTLIAVNVSAGIQGGEISGVRFAPNPTGFDVYVGDKVNGPNAQPIIIDSNNYFSGQLSIKTDGAGLTAGAVRQSPSCQFIAAATTLDLRAASKFVVFNAGPVNLVDITNRIPGMELKIYNSGAGTVTVDASLMASGVASSIASGTTKSFMVLGYPIAGKFVEI